MFRTAQRTVRLPHRFPRVCGDVPNFRFRCRVRVWFSPRVRGCSHLPSGDMLELDVFPACAGMFLPPHRSTTISWRFPRVCGDVPNGCTPPLGKPAFSPRVRGCSCGSTVVRMTVGVFPACAGMFRGHADIATGYPRFPRVCGDVPVVSTLLSVMCVVFPACAGMFRKPS